MGFFDSPRERKAEELYGGEMKSFDDILNEIDGMNSSYSGLNDAGGVRKKFGITPITEGSIKKTVGGIYDPLRRNLATRRAQGLSSARSRMGIAGSAMPEGYFSPVEEYFSGAFGNLESSAGQAEQQERGRMTQQEEFVASLLNDVLGKQDNFGFNKTGLKLQGQGAKSDATSRYLQSLSGASSFDDILALLGEGSKMAGLFV